MTNPLKTIQSVERAFALLEALGSLGGQARLSELVSYCGLNKTTAHGLLNTLISLGYVQRQDNLYRLGSRLSALAQPVMAQHESVRNRYQALLDYAARQSGETSYLAVPGGNQDYVYAEAIQGGNSLRLANPRGKREKLNTSAIGKVFLAFTPQLVRQLRKTGSMSESLSGELAEIYRQGYALDLEQAEIGLNCLALPLYDNGDVIAVLGVAGPAARLPESRLHTLAGQLQRVHFSSP